MKVLPFTMLVPTDKSVISEHISLPHFYQYLHRHDEWQLTYIQEGEGTLIIGNNMHTFRAGDVFLIGAKMPHLFKSNPDYFLDEPSKIVRACSLYFNPAGAMSALFNLPELVLASSFLAKHRHGFKVPAAHCDEISTKMFNVHRANGCDVLFDFLKLVNALQQLSDKVEPLCSEMYDSNVSENEGARLSKIIGFITENYNNQITLEDVAEAAFMTPQAFCRYFKKHTGNTFIAFLNEVRVNDACKSLLSGKNADCISGVAYKAGFNSITNFNRVFKSIVGKSPRAYIDTYRNVSSLMEMAG